MSKWLLALLVWVLAFTLVDEAERATEPPPPAPASISLSDASAIVRQAYGGRVVSAVHGKREVEGATQRGYWVRVDVDGRIKKVFVDLRGRIHEQGQ